MVDETVIAPPILVLKEISRFHCPESETIVGFYESMVNAWNERKPQFRTHNETTAIRHALHPKTIREDLKIQEVEPEVRREIVAYLFENAPDGFKNWFEDGTLLRPRSEWDPFLVEASHVITEAKKRSRLAKNS